MAEPVRTIDDGLDGIAALREIARLADEWERARSGWSSSGDVYAMLATQDALAAAVRARRGA